jgi:HAD superfamily hydrolase (TIGR01509 family)
MASHFLVIFDCDGVLIDSEVIDVRVGRLVLAQLGLNLSREEFVKRFVGQTAAQFTASVEAVLGYRLEATWRDAYAAWYDSAYERDLKAVPGIGKALDAIRGPICVASNSTREKVRRNLARTGLLERFEPHIYSAEDVPRGKPSPDLFLHAARAMNVAPHRCIVVEDSRFGVRAARAAGMRVFAYAGGVTPAEWLRGRRTTVFSKMIDLPGLIDDALSQQTETQSRE